MIFKEPTFPAVLPPPWCLRSCLAFSQRFGEQKRTKAGIANGTKLIDVGNPHKLQFSPAPPLPIMEQVSVFVVTLALVFLALRWLPRLLAPLATAPPTIWQPLDHTAFHQCDLPQLNIRPLESADHPFCQRLFYDLQDASLSPRGHEHSMQEWLESDSNEKWVITSRGTPLACCGLAIDLHDHNASLSFGLLDLDHRKLGLGSISLAFRLSLLPDQQDYFVYLWATTHSENYYRRFGFVRIPSQIIPAPEDFTGLTPLGVILKPHDHEFLRRFVEQHQGI